MERKYGSQIYHWNVWLQFNRRVTTLKNEASMKNCAPYPNRLQNVCQASPRLLRSNSTRHDRNPESSGVVRQNLRTPISVHKTRCKSNPLTVLLRHRHKGLPQRDTSREVKYIPNHRMPFRSWGKRQPSILSSPVDQSQRGSDGEQCASERRDGHHRRGGVKGVVTESSYVCLEIYIGVIKYVQIVCLSRRP